MDKLLELVNRFQALKDVTGTNKSSSYSVQFHFDPWSDRVQIEFGGYNVGHCKSRQFANSSSYFNATWSGKWSKERLISEVNAWKWGIRYFKRLGFKMTDELVKIVQWSLDGYFKNSEDPVVAHNLSRDFEAYSGIKTETKHIPVDFTGCISYTSPIKVDKPKVAPKGHKPWHDLKAQQMKKAWRNQR